MVQPDLEFEDATPPVGHDPRTAWASDARRTPLPAVVLALGHRRPQEVPLLDGEWQFIAVNTPEVADAAEPRSQRQRVTDPLIRCPNRDRSDSTKQ